MEELSLHILDIARNSIKANATYVFITIDEAKNKEKIVIEISDDGCGMDEETLSRVTDPFFSSRESRKIGLGIPFFKMAALMSGGSFDIESTLGEGTTVKASFLKSNIDTMPLGNIVDTIITLMSNEKNVDVKFKHKLENEIEITFDTEVVKEIFDGFNLTNPKVIVACRKHLKNEYYMEE